MDSQQESTNIVNHLFRKESGKMISVLVKIFGTDNFNIAEDVVQEALLTALESWKFYGIPDNPKAWLYRVAKNKAIDTFRQKKYNLTIDFTDPQLKLLDSGYTLQVAMDGFWDEHKIKDDFLGMMFACCHPNISPDYQIVFILKSLCGFSTREIARAFLIEEDTVSKRLYRTKQFFRQNKIRPKIPGDNALGERLNSVLGAIYLVFNEGFHSAHSDDLIRRDLLSEAVALLNSLLENEKMKTPPAYALMALFCFHIARIEGRISHTGEMVLLDQQDRGLWDPEWILTGNEYLNKAAFGDSISAYHLEAAIAYEHCIAKTYESTNWEKILEFYDTLTKLTPDPVFSLNRCIVILKLYGATPAYDALMQISEQQRLNNYYLFHAIEGEIHRMAGKGDLAAQSFLRAKDLTGSQIEIRALEKKIRAINTPG